ncbi:MAG: molybdenum cofactor guanylyltransferase [Pseudohongiella sp.]|nr:molybdenum cofactor guanylyltransferase [Pseudohongiella sp.]
MIQRAEIAAVILAGGKGSRMNYQDKALLTLHKKPLIEHVIANVRNQVGSLSISVNHNPHLYEYLQLPLVPDYGNQYAGPLVGIYSAMRRICETRQQSGIKYLACFAADVPYFPSKLVASLYENLMDTNSQFACCVCDNQLQPLFSLWKLETISCIESAISKGVFGPKLLLPELSHVLVEIPFDDPGYFLNINSAESLAMAERMIPAN